jgi:hypothetical protein
MSYSSIRYYRALLLRAVTEITRGSISGAAFAREACVRYSALALVATCATDVHAHKKAYITAQVMPNDGRIERSIRNSFQLHRGGFLWSDFSEPKRALRSWEIYLEV